MGDLLGVRGGMDRVAVWAEAVTVIVASARSAVSFMSQVSSQLPSIAGL